MGIEEQSTINGKSNHNGVGFICGVVEGFYGRPWTNEQRKNLFERMKVMGLNTYMYGPKDDLKHRFEWRALYNDEEIELLRSLVQSAKMNNVHFVYSISPGIDIIYSQPSEVKAIIRKLKQVEELGCTSFALLFDDIEITMNEQDAKIFPSFVAAQIAVTNEVYSSINSEMFYFCPTEYCSTRTIPDLTHSNYLNTLGNKLAQGIEIMWTGPQVVAVELTPEHAEDVSKVLKRKPLIWDNYHANDYDPKRVFLGPLKERPVALKNHICGLLLNPNCKFEANFVPFYTLSIWNQCEKDEDALEEDGVTFSNGPIRSIYNPSLALEEALDKWLDLYLQNPGLTIPPISSVECTMVSLTPVTPESTALVLPPTIRTCEGNDLLPSINGSAPPLYTSAIGSATTVTVQAYPNPIENVSNVPSYFEKEEITDETLLTANSLLTTYGETLTESNQNSQNEICSMVAEKGSGSAEVSMEEDFMENDNRITHEQLALLVDIFYLPFDYGEQALNMLEDFQFMHKNSHILRQNRELDADTIVEWNCRYENFQTKASRFELFFRLFLESPNRSLVQELFPYVSEAHATLAILSAILSWMREGNLTILPSHTIENWWKNRLLNVEPWAFGNGLLPDLQKMVISSPELANLFLYKTPIPLLISSYKIEPIVTVDDLDPQLCYDLFSYQAEREFYDEISPVAATDMFFDRYFGLHFKNTRPTHNFQIKEIDSHGNSNLFATITACFSLHTTMPYIKTEFLDNYRDKFVEMLSDNKKGEEMFLKELEQWPVLHLPKTFLQKYPSFIEIRWRNSIQEAAWVRRLFQCVASALTLNGSNGLFVIVPEADEDRINLFYRFGLSAINDVKIDNHLVMGHLLQTSG